jgi:hypothetical protein
VLKKKKHQRYTRSGTLVLKKKKNILKETSTAIPFLSHDQKHSHAPNWFHTN